MAASAGEPQPIAAPVPPLALRGVPIAIEVGALLVLSALFPFLVHILPVPEDARLGARLLPMFYAPLLAVLVGRPHSALLVAAAAPWLNWALTGHPGPRTVWLTAVQLLAFVVGLRGLLRLRHYRAFLAAPAYLGCLTVAATVAAVYPAAIGGRSPVFWAWQTLVTGLPGVGMLLLLNWFTIRQYPSGGDGHGPAAA